MLSPPWRGSVLPQATGNCKSHIDVNLAGARSHDGDRMRNQKEQDRLEFDRSISTASFLLVEDEFSKRVVSSCSVTPGEGLEVDLGSS